MRYFTFIIKYPAFILLSVFLLCGSALADKMKVAFINPTYPNEPFWSLVTDVMTAAANQLDIELHVLYSDRNRFKSLELVKALSRANSKPDYLIFHFQAQMGAEMLSVAEQAGIYSMVINTDIPEADKKAIGQPRGKFKNWLGHIVPKDFQAGELLAEALIEQAIRHKQFAKDGRIHAIALTGTGDNTASSERDKGLKHHVKGRENVLLHQIVNAGWDKQKARDITKVLMTRYPETRVIWSASDMMAMGAIDALDELGYTLGKDVYVGGIDGILLGLEAIKSGKLSATISGHFIEGAWALLLLYEHFHGNDLLADKASLLRSDMSVINADNVQAFMSKVQQAYFDVIGYAAFTSQHQSIPAHGPLTFPKVLMSEFQIDSPTQ